MHCVLRHSGYSIGYVVKLNKMWLYIIQLLIVTVSDWFWKQEEQVTVF
jgi:hypothetical protein